MGIWDSRYSSRISAVATMFSALIFSRTDLVADTVTLTVSVPSSTWYDLWSWVTTSVYSMETGISSKVFVSTGSSIFTTSSHSIKAKINARSFRPILFVRLFFMDQPSFPFC